MTATQLATSTYGDLVAGEVRAWLGRRGWKQAELAVRMNEDEFWVSRKLRGRTRITVDDLPRFAAALGCDVGDLLPRLDSNQQPFGSRPALVSGGLAA